MFLDPTAQPASTPPLDMFRRFQVGSYLTVPPSTTHSNLRSKYSRQASYWNAFFFILILASFKQAPKKILKHSPEVWNWWLKCPIMLKTKDNTFLIFFLFFIKVEPNDLFIILPLHCSYLSFPFFLPLSFYYRNIWSQLLPIWLKRLSHQPLNWISSKSQTWLKGNFHLLAYFPFCLPDLWLSTKLTNF